jgi:diphthamide synthase (EF-2-diphthine--ammonia ligase)
MERKELESQYRLERDICAGANASEYHKKRFAELSKELGKADGTKMTNVKTTKSVETVMTSGTETVATISDTTNSEDVTIVSTDEAPKKK